ncbi:MAG: WbqC family protein [Bacteroidia bacterium]|jgi:hypothetical protein
MKVVILQSNYLPWKGYFDLINDADVFCFYDEVQYTKNDWRNRNRIYSKNGLHWISIPINKDAVKGKISQAKLPGNWQMQHYKSIKLAYGRAPFISNLDQIIYKLYFENNFEYLAEFNQYSIQTICSYLGIKTKFMNSNAFELKGDRIQRLINLLKLLKATEYISGPSAINYLSGQEHYFLEEGIKLTFKDYKGYPEYSQLNKPFENYVSIVDMIANLHQDEIKNYIWEWRTR